MAILIMPKPLLPGEGRGAAERPVRLEPGPRLETIEHEHGGL